MRVHENDILAPSVRLHEDTLRRENAGGQGECRRYVRVFGGRLLCDGLFFRESVSSFHS
jgi:hypothetical protein